jgi:hypothetical protein
MPEINFQVNEQTTLRALEKLLEKEPEVRRRYLGASSIGEECKRKLWYSFRWHSKKQIPAKNKLAILDGHEQEARMFKMLNKLPGVNVFGDQSELTDFKGFFEGHIDGFITGVLEAPSTKHIWEHKSCNQKKFDLLKKLLEQHDQKEVLLKWDSTYYAQAQIYMHYFDLKRHFLTVTAPGGRDWLSVRTNYSKKDAMELRAKAHEIINAPEPPARGYSNKDYYKCKWCEHQAVCWYGFAPERNCRTCAHSSPADSGEFRCELKRMKCGNFERKGCREHFFIPSALSLLQVSAERDENKRLQAIIYQRERDKLHFINRKGAGTLKVIE